jgi:hypothetical protein
MPAGVCDFEPSILCQSWVCFIAQVIQILLISWPSTEVCVCVFVPAGLQLGLGIPG